MLDGVKLNREGVCSVVVSKESFLDEVASQAEVLNMPDLPIVSVPETLTVSDWLHVAEDVVDEIVERLTSSAESG